MRDALYHRNSFCSRGLITIICAELQNHHSTLLGSHNSQYQRPTLSCVINVKISNPRPTKRARANLTGDAHVTHLTQDSTVQPANGKIDCEEVLRLVDQLGHAQLCDIVTKAAKAYSDVATDIHNTIEDMREKERNRVINFDSAFKSVWHDINVAHRKLEGSQQCDVAGDVWYDTVDTIDSIVHRCGPFTSLQTRLNGLSALRRIGKTIRLSDSGVGGHEVRKQCQGDHCLEEAMIEILSTMSKGERREIREENSSEEALWPKLLELDDLAYDLCLFERLNEVLDFTDPPREVDDASDGEDSEDEEGSEYFGEEGEDEEEEICDENDVQDYDNPANQPWITDSSNGNHHVFQVRESANEAPLRLDGEPRNK